MTTLSSTTSWAEGDPLSPTHFNRKLDPLIANIASVNAVAGSGYYNVKDYGAVGGGVTDDAPSIYSAAVAAQNANGTLFFPIGQYLIGSTITLTNAVMVLGSGRSTVVIEQASAGKIMFLAQGLTSFDTIPWIIFKDISIDGNLTGQANAGLLQINNVNQLLVSNVVIRNGGDTSVATTGGMNGIAVSAGDSSSTAIPTRGVIRDCLIEKCTKAGINVSTNASDMLITGNIVRECAGNGVTPGIQVNGAHQIAVIGNSVYSNQGRGIYVNSTTTPPVNARHVNVIGNHVYNNGGSSNTEGAGIAVMNVEPTVRYGKTIVQGNNVHHNGKTGEGVGIYVQNQNDVVVNGNIAYFNRDDGCFVDGCVNVSVTANQFLSNNSAANSPVAGIRVKGSDTVLIDGNISVDTRGGSATQDQGLTLFTSACTNVVVTNNVLWPNKTGTISVSSAPVSMLLRNNVGKNQSQATILAANYTVDPTDHFIGIASSSTLTVTLPSAASFPSARFAVKRLSTGTVIITTSSGSLDSAATVALTTVAQVQNFQSYGTGYFLA